MIRNAMRLVVLAVAVACTLPAEAGYESGQEAWDAGRPDEALAQWWAAADAGDRRAMLALGRLFAQGLGVPQDYVQAHKWFNLAASRGEAAAVGERDALAAKMTPQQVATAQELARSWQPGGGGAAAGTGDVGTTVGSTGAPAAAQASASDADVPPWAVREAQALLKELGYAPGPVDGVWGQRTGQAYQAFLRDGGLPATERLTPEALEAMRASAEGGGVEPGPAPETSPPSTGASASRLGGGPPDALHQAARMGDVAGLQALLESGVDVDVRDGQGWTALMYAVNKGYTLLVEPLLAADADSDVRAPDGATALFMAAVHGHTEVIALLMDAGADVSVKGPKGMMVEDVASTLGDSAVLRALGIREAGDVFRDCPECPEMVVVPAGSFMMGSPESEENREGDEGPVHGVTIARTFAVGVKEVTRGEYGRFVSATGRSMGNSSAGRLRVMGTGSVPVVIGGIPDSARRTVIRWYA